MITPHKKRKAKEDISPWEKLKRRGLTLPGYNYLGPFNAEDNGTPTNGTDRAAKRHDGKYKELLKNGYNPYTNYSKADDDFIKEANGTDYGAYIGRGVFRTKKVLAQAGVIGTIRHSSIRQEPSNTLRSEASGVVSMNSAGSGNEPGLTETPIDKVDPHKVYRGPPSYTFASLPFAVDAVLRDDNVYARDIVLRMTSPYDPIVKMNTVDLNTNSGTTKVVVALGDGLDDDLRPANWFNFYAGMYKYYHVISCRYHIFIENYGEPIWVYKMFYNEEVPDPGASNLDMQLWPNVEYHYLNAPYGAVESTGQFATNSFIPESANQSNIQQNNETRDVTSDGIVSYNSSNHVQTRSGTTTCDIFGEYSPGDFAREIRLDSDVENWTLTTSNPKLPERLDIRIKPQNNGYKEDSLNTFGDDIKYRVRIQLSYLVEFKELQKGLQYPVQNQPITVTIAQNPTTL